MPTFMCVALPFQALIPILGHVLKSGKKMLGHAARCRANDTIIPMTFGAQKRRRKILSFAFCRRALFRLP
ncbi:hypothetical protein PHAMO_40103 [Magnetospirillum molischianum DSM 120]|uniref:Uncharacterized protein n=1 Tax=Magnetospirillum molischianum DSM 120 TaxID=1150626 RepID=H8FW04_MAGML|nr:hypothetical protein PHAMO_40103 [Magnetospirillum molischianum DSM 120]